MDCTKTEISDTITKEVGIIAPEIEKTYMEVKENTAAALLSGNIDGEQFSANDNSGSIIAIIIKDQ